MPAIYECAFPVRFYECDMYGHVNHANYLRYMQEAAFGASAAVGYDKAGYDQMGQHWLVRESNIEYLSPLRYGDSVRVRTWVADIRRVRSQRVYELWRVHAAGEELAARAVTDWVFFDSANGRPTTVPAPMINAFLPDGLPAEAPARERFPDAPPTPPGLFTMRRRVAWTEVDPAGHVNNACYPTYAEDCALQDAAGRGWPITRMINEAGFAIVARRYRIEYLQPALLDDELEVATWIADVKRITAVRHFTIRRTHDQALLARIHSLWAWVDVQTGRPVRIPSHFLADFATNISA
jgi:acyl-CoA thioester hydrolase